MSQRSRSAYVSLALSSLLLASAGCKGGEGGGSRGAGERGGLSETTSLLLAEGRWVTTEVFEHSLDENGNPISVGSKVERTPLYTAPGTDNGYTELLWGLLYSCLNDLAETPEHPWYPSYCAEVPDRLTQTDLLEDGTPRFPNVEARSDQLSFRDLCLGHRALEIASSATGGYLYGTVPQVTLTSTPPPAGTLLNRKFPVASASDKASWALFAADRFRDAALYFTDALGNCQGTNLNAPPGTATGSTYGQLLATGLADAMSSMMEATEVAEKNVLAASQAKRGNTKQEQSEAVTKAWRDRHDSRLEVASVWGPVASKKFEPEGDAGVGEGSAERYPVATLNVEGKGDLRAEELIRSTRVNPCLGGMGHWCQEALVGQANRGAMDIALDILQAFQARGGNVTKLATNTPMAADQSALELLRKQGVNLADLEHAARRIVEQAEVMGQAIVPDPDADGSVVPDAGVSPPALVLGTVATGAPASPYYLYARTVGSTPWGLFDPANPSKTSGHVEFDGNPPVTGAPDISFSNFSVSATALQVDERLSGLIPYLDGENVPAHARIMAEVKAYAHELAPLRSGVMVSQWGAPPWIWLARLEVPWPGSTNEEVQQRCGVWFGEAGLECGLTGQINGGRCDTARYKAPANFAYNGGFAILDEADMPSRPWVNGGTPGFAPEERLYWICDVPQRGLEVLMAAEVTKPPADEGTWTAMMPPMSDQTLSSLSRTLAADPVKPQQSALSCAGVPYNVKVALEDELTEAFTGQDGIESSFAYYLKLAREATERADQLGEQLVEQGLQLDLRAEQARENLEDLCGGIVDVSKLETAACNDDDKCDIMAMLLRTSGSEQTTTGLGGVSDSELAGVRSCLGIGERAKPVWAALGDQTLCVPQYYPAPGSPVPPPGVCPVTSTVCEPLAHMGVGGPRVLTCDGTTSSCTCGNTYFAGTPLGEDIEGERPTTEALRIRTISDKLNIFITAVDTKDIAAKFPGSTSTPVSPAEGPTAEHPCESLVKLRRIGMAQENPSQASTYLSGASTALPSPDWANLARLRGVAEQIGFTESVFGIPTVTLNGRPWLTLGNTAQGFVAPDQDWPFGPAPWTDTEECDLFPKNWQSTPLACGLTLQTAATPVLSAGKLNTTRLKAAVQVLKGITGTSFENVFSAVDLPGQPTLNYGNLYNARNLPGWFGSGVEHWMAEDGTEMWYNSGTSFYGRKVVQVAEPILGVPGAGDEGVVYGLGAGSPGGFISPNHMWSSGTSCFDSVPTATVTGCGSVASLLRGEWTSRVNSQIQHKYLCPKVTDDQLVLKWSCAPKGNSNYTFEQCRQLREYLPLSRYSFGSKNAAGKFADDGTYTFDKEYKESFNSSGIGVNSGGVCECSVPAGTKVTLRTSELVTQYQYASDPEKWLADNRSARQFVAHLNCGPQVVGTELSPHSILDGLELACMAMNSGAANCNTVLRSPLKIDSIEDFPKVRARVECAARGAQESLDRMYLGGVPQDVVNALGAGGAGMLQSFPEFRGDYGRVVAELGARLVALRAQADSIVQKYRDVGAMFEVSRLQSQVTDLNIASDTIDAALAQNNFDAQKLEAAKKKLRTRQAISNSVTSCINAMIPSGWTGFITGNAYFEIAKGANTCANSAVQIASELEIQGLDQKILNVQADQFENILEKIRLSKRLTEVEEQVMFAKLARDIASKMDEMQQAGAAMAQIQAEIHGHLSQLDSIRNQARREAAKVLMLSNDDVGRAYGVNSSMRARMNTLRVRYESARDDAIRLSYMARRSVEQRLGVDMSNMEDDMTLVAAPRTWVDELCTLSGIDYEEIRQGGASGGTEIQTTRKDFNYADAYVGDWLTKLENFVQAYRLDYPFQDGGDVAVVSLRDEIMRAKQECELPGWNQLFYSDGEGGSLPGQAEVVDFKGVKQLKSVWQYPCREGRRVGIKSSDPQSPFQCLSAEIGNCRALGDARAVYLNEDVGCEDASSAAVGGASAPPSTGLVYHYDASTCTHSPGVGAAVCPDRSALNNPLMWSGASPAVVTGAGGVQAVRIAAGTTLAPSQARTPTMNYTVSVVVYRGRRGLARLIGDADGTTALELQAHDGQGAHVGALSQGSSWYEAWAGSPGVRTKLRNGVSVPRADIYTIRAGTDHSVELYVNGALRSRASGTPIPTKFDLVAKLVDIGNGTDPLELSAALGYQERLSDTNLRALHEYLSRRFDVAIDGPVHWLSGDVVAQLRATGTSALSGQNLGMPAPTTFMDGVMFQPVRAASGDITSAALGTLGGHNALIFDGEEDSLSFNYFGELYEQTSPEGETTSGPVPTASEYTLTMVARCEPSDAPVGNLFSTDLVSASGGPFDRYMSLGMEAGTGRVVLRNQFTGQTLLSDAGDLPCTGTPFIVSLRGSQSTSSMEVFVNGSSVIRHPAFWKVFMNPIYADDASFRGALAESLIYLRSMSDAELKTQHASLGAKYGITTASGGVATNPAATGPARMLQARAVSAGEYWVTWHQKSNQARLGLRVDLPGGAAPVEIAPGAAATATNAIWPRGTSQGVIDPWLAPGWVRHMEKVTVPFGGEAAFGFVLPPGNPELNPIAFAAPQVERIDQGYSEQPKEYFATTSKLSATVDQCEDRDGSAFRAMWDRGCEYYCPPGLGNDCAADGDVLGLPKRCYHELKFPISLEEIEKGELIPAAGFARGNFNYRFDQLAMNFVGTAVKNCQGTGLQSACFGSNFLQYSLRHAAPYRIRNYDGDVIDAPLFTGNVQQAKGLLAERYVSNPIASADESLVRDYWRDEFRGRPIDGNFALRVYDADGLDFGALKDVQVLLRYRYWTRFER